MTDTGQTTLVVGVIGGRAWLAEHMVEISLRAPETGALSPVTRPPPAPLDLLLFLVLHPGSHKPATVKQALYRSIKDGHKPYDHARGVLRDKRGVFARHLVGDGRIGALNAECDLIELLKAAAEGNREAALGILEQARIRRGGDDALSDLVLNRKPAWPHEEAAFQTPRFGGAANFMDAFAAARAWALELPQPDAHPPAESEQSSERIARLGSAWRRRLPALATVVGALLAGGLAFGLSRDASPPPTPQRASPCPARAWKTDPADERVTALLPDSGRPRQVGAVKVGIKPAALAAGREGVWVAERQGVTLIDPRRRREAFPGIAVTNTPPGPNNAPYSLALTRGRVWAARRDGWLVSIDRLTRTRVGPAVHYGKQGGTVAVGQDGGIWVNNYEDGFDGHLTRIDPCSGRLTRVRVGRQANTVYAAFGSLWVTNSVDGALERVNPHARRKVASVGGLDDPQDVIAADGLLWVLQYTNGTVQRVDPKTNRKVGRPIRVGADPGGVTVGAGSLWIALYGNGTLTRLDLSTGRAMLRVARAGTSPSDVVVAFGRVWAPNNDGDTVTVVDP